MGYWPKELFSSLSDGVKILSVGGIVNVGPNKISPPMGSGYREKCQYNHDAFFANVRYQTSKADHQGRYISPYVGDTKTTVDCPNLHAVRDKCKNLEDMGFYFMYGGERGVCA